MNRHILKLNVEQKHHFLTLHKQDTFIFSPDPQRAHQDRGGGGQHGTWRRGWRGWGSLAAYVWQLRWTPTFRSSRPLQPLTGQLPSHAEYWGHRGAGFLPSHPHHSTGSTAATATAAAAGTITNKQGCPSEYKIKEDWYYRGYLFYTYLRLVSCYSYLIHIHKECMNIMFIYVWMNLRQQL